MRIVKFVQHFVRLVLEVMPVQFVEKVILSLLPSNVWRIVRCLVLLAVKMTLQSVTLALLVIVMIVQHLHALE